MAELKFLTGEMRDAQDRESLCKKGRLVPVHTIEVHGGGT